MMTVIDKNSSKIQDTQPISAGDISKHITSSWAKIAPFWPLKNLIAVNPISGFEDLSFQEGLRQAQAYFQQAELPNSMQVINRETIKWLQVFFDDGQSRIHMPNRHLGLLQSTLLLLKYDENLHQDDIHKLTWLEHLPKNSEKMILQALSYLEIPKAQYQDFLTLMLTTLPGWAGYVQYRTNWADAQDAANKNKVTQSDYLALRLIITCLLWPQAKELLTYHCKALEAADSTQIHQQIQASEQSYRQNLLKQLDLSNVPVKPAKSKAQLVFCIDVRSEPFRRALEAQGNYETYGFAGFFGVPITIQDAVTGHSHASCPVLLKPSYTITEHPTCDLGGCQKKHHNLSGFRRLYQSLKYNFTTPFSLVETIGVINGLWMGFRSIFPKAASLFRGHVHQAIAADYAVVPDIESIPLEQQIAYGSGALKMMGLTENFAPLVVFCGHGSQTQNNAYATALDCGACGGRHGAPNARILAAILNNSDVRQSLRDMNIIIPGATKFIAAEHNTTTDEVEIYADQQQGNILELKQDLENARHINSLWRAQEMDIDTNQSHIAAQKTAIRAHDWAQVRPEWGLARNAAFVIGPRWLSKKIDLEGRSFLHSYEWQKDTDQSALTIILTAPMVVTQWINAQYLFSALDNVAFGGGSKITKNITGKIGIMQGNASDLMTGLPLQSVYKSDTEKYHNPMRLNVIVYAPQTHIDPIIAQQEILQKLFGNGWVNLICCDPIEQQKFMLQRDFSWVQL